MIVIFKEYNKSCKTTLFWPKYYKKKLKTEKQFRTNPNRADIDTVYNLILSRIYFPTWDAVW